ncbi:hypothetical protein OQA88_2793 [Cercophora sp. LCS_1]
MAVMECAGRALNFWAYQMSSQMLLQIKANRDLQEHCSYLEGEVKNVWHEGHSRMTKLNGKIKDMELREQALLQKCEDLRTSLSEKTKELARSQDLYGMLKQRVLLNQSPGSAAGLRSSKAAPAPGSPSIPDPPRHSGAYSHRPLGGGIPESVGNRKAAPKYFPNSPNCTNPPTGPAPLSGWNKPLGSHS